MIEFTYSHFAIGIAVLACILLYFARQKRSLWYLLFLSIFWMYLLYIVSVIVFPIAPLPEEYSEAFRPNINLVPFYFGNCDIMPGLCITSIIGNILLTMPFGFGVSFIARLRRKDFVWLPLFVGMMFEATQLIISFVFLSPFRAVDINDVILNATGVLLGYGVFQIFGWLYLYVIQRFEIHHKFIFAYISDVVRQS